jgi:hypothetical protein
MPWFRHADPARTYAGALRPLAAGSAGFFASVAMCLAITHDGTVEHDGISYFSVRAPTLPVILLGYASVTAGMLAAARRFPDDGLGRRLALPMRCLPVFFVLLLLTPFNQGTAFNWTHMTVGVTLALSQLVVTIWLCSVLPSTRVLLAAVVELTGGVIAAASLPGTSFNYLFIGELLFNVGFCLCLLAVVADAARVPADPSLGESYAQD